MSVVFKKKLGKPSPSVMGIDPSTKTGIVVLDGQRGSPVAGNWRQIVQFTAEKYTGFTRLQALAKTVGRALDENDDAEVFIEGLAYGNRFTLVLMAQIGCVIRLELCKRDRGWWDVPPSLLKKWTTGKGRADKQDMVNATMARWGFFDASDDVVDAYALAQLGRYMLAGNPMKGVVRGN